MRHSPRTTWSLTAALLCALAAAAACGRKDAPVGADASLSGRWTGNAQFNLLQFSATFTQDGEEVSGLGSFSSPLASGPFTVVGSFVSPRVSLTLVSAELGSTGYEGTLTSANEITGRLTTPPYDGWELTLRRE